MRSIFVIARQRFVNARSSRETGICVNQKRWLSEMIQHPLHAATKTQKPKTFETRRNRRKTRRDPKIINHNIRYVQCSVRAPDAKGTRRQGKKNLRGRRGFSEVVGKRGSGETEGETPKGIHHTFRTHTSLSEIQKIGFSPVDRARAGTFTIMVL
jgi:hypothetical protein